MTENSPYNRVVILGGGTAGWMTAAGLVSLLGPAGIDVTLVESEAIGTVGVGEATLPHLRFFNQTLGIDELDFMAKTRATIKLGIEFVDWGRKGDSYIHPFGDYGISNDGIGFHHFWRKFSETLGPICEYSFPVVAARKARFAPPSDDASSVLSTFRYAYQFDATQYAPYLRRIGEERGVKRVEGRVVGTQLSETGDIQSILLESGQQVLGDFFVDCSGFRGLLIEDALSAGYEDWTHWLPCDRAVAAACEHEGPLLPYTRATAREFGWQWRIPLQHRTGNGYVYSSEFASDQSAHERLVQSLEGSLISEPKLLYFKTGKRKKLWSRNCVAIGLSGGFLEPLESTSIYLIQQGITYLIEMLQGAGDPGVARLEYNRMMDMEFERIRDFLILHYVATEREDTEFWRYMRSLKLPDSLDEKMALFRAAGRVQTYDHGLFLEPSWLAVYLGQRIFPADYDPRVDQFPPSEIVSRLSGLRDHIDAAAGALPSHADWIGASLSNTTPGVRMTGIDSTICVRGDPVSAWLTAAVVVRFVSIDTLRVEVNEVGEWPSDTVLVRPEISRLHTSIGLDVSALPGTKKVSGWSASGKPIPLSPFGTSLKGMSFPNIWSRGRRHSGCEDLWGYNSMASVKGLYEVSAAHYADAVTKIAINVGVVPFGRSDHPPLLTIDSSADFDAASAKDETIGVGAALVKGAFPSPLRLYALDICLRVLIGNWPRIGALGPEVVEYERRASEALAFFAEMHALLEHDQPCGDALMHRINVWRELGRIVPVDNDPFTQPEWIGALLHAGYQPAGYPRILDTIPEAEILNHLRRHAVREMKLGA